MGYFELEQRLGAAGAPRDSGAGATAAASGGGGITLKVYGDVWRWLGDGKVCSLREQVVEARFSLVHVKSVARKAATIAQVGFSGKLYVNTSKIRVRKKCRGRMRLLHRASGGSRRRRRLSPRDIRGRVTMSSDVRSRRTSPIVAVCVGAGRLSDGSTSRPPLTVSASEMCLFKCTSIRE